MDHKQILVILLFFFSNELTAQRSFQLASPSALVNVSVQVGDSIYYSVSVAGAEVITRSPLAMITPSITLGVKCSYIKNSNRSVNEIIVNPVPFKRKKIPNHFNELTLLFREKFSIVFRAYDDGAAYRFVTTSKDSLEIRNEIASFRFPRADTVYFPQIQKRENLDIFHSAFEEPYSKLEINSIGASQVAFSPLLIDGSVKVIITESDLYDYPGMFLRGTGKNELQGIFAGYPQQIEIQGSDFKQPVVVKRENYISKASGQRSFPWRVILLAKKDADLLTNDLVYRLGAPSSSNDWSWVKPGISTEEWIVNTNLYGVDFKSGINTATYKYYIDFASHFGMQYVMLDAGWSDANDLFKIHPGLNLEEVSAYAKSKNIDLILWTLSMTLDRQLDKALDMFNSLGVKVIMTDFMDRDDQQMVNFYHRIAEATSKHHIMVMFHGAFKNAGLERKYPNAITREAVLGSEYNIWSEKATPGHDLTIPFIRMVSGPMDYEPGSMLNANKRTFRALPDHVMSQGTRCHQLAMFVVYDNPLQMFSGNPSDAWLDEKYMRYLSSIPTTWDETIVLDAKIGKYLLLARKKENDWYLAAMTDWSAREMEADLSFLAQGSYRALSCEDGINAVQHAADYEMKNELVSATDKLRIKMAPGGGYVVKLIKVDGKQ